MSPRPLKWLDPAVIEFPPLESALRDPNGLLALGGDISPAWLLAAYRRGIFPWYEEGQPILWWSPDPRMVLLPGTMHVSRSLRRLARRGRYRVTFDTCFHQVIAACASRAVRRDTASADDSLYSIRRQATWITRGLQASFQRLHALGHAHSVEVWEGECLVGGLYGLALGRAFFGESMFYRRPDASKLALWHLERELQARNYGLIDCQIASPHLFSLGAREVPRHRFQHMLRESLEDGPAPGLWTILD